MIYKFSKELYTKDSVLKAAYTFTDNFYIHLQADDNEYIVEIQPKKSGISISCEEFKNEIIAQQVREIIYKQTKDLRMLIMARAFSSSVISENNDVLPKENQDYELENIMKDWFDENE